LKTEEENMEQKICFYEETNFKNTTEIGEVPADWEVVKLEQVGEVLTGNTPSKAKKEYWINGTIDFVKPPDLRNSCITTASEKISEYAVHVARLVPPGSVLVSCVGNIGRVGYSLKKIAFNQQINAIVPNDTINSIYLFFALQTQAEQIEKLKAVTTIPIVNKSKFMKVLIPLPPLEEQKAIAYVLSTVQEAREKTEKVIEATKELKKSLMQHLFTYGPVSLEEASRINLKETEIGEIPTDWEVVKLGDLQKKGCLRIKNGFAQGNWNDEGIGIPQIRPFNITEDGRINFESMKYVQFSEGIEDYALQPGDVIFNNTNSEELVGKTAYWNREGKFTLSNHMTLLRVEKNEILDPLFLASYLHKNWMDGFYLQVRRRYVNQASVTLNVLKDLPLPLPALPVQKRIAEILQTVDEKTQAEEKKKQALDNLFNSMLHMLMSGKLRVKFRTGEEEESG